MRRLALRLVVGVAAVLGIAGVVAVVLVRGQLPDSAGAAVPKVAGLVKPVRAAFDAA